MPVAREGGGVPIVLDEVDFRYETGNRSALDAANFEAEAGKTIALVGPSGAGKTTIAHLLMRFTISSPSKGDQTRQATRFKCIDG